MFTDNNYYRNRYAAHFWGGAGKVKKDGTQKKWYVGHPAQVAEKGTKTDSKSGAVGAWFNSTSSKGEPIVIFRFVEGPTKEGWNRGPRTPKPLTLGRAKSAFEKYYTYSPGGRWKSPRGAALARTYDINRGPKKPEYLISDRRYKRNPHKYDYAGVDVGPKSAKVASAKQLENLRRGRALSPKGKKSPSRTSSASSTASTASAYGGLWNRYY